ncbi:MAG: hypothetical protein ACR2MZ_10610 [Candidatus Dormibacter sp.]|uniref:hypothetical protein n=1 Tax=Candidatus Dormibacter sp. TaxID=2973982 RepID=UPI000DB88BA2|nr:MAG: hypothetical protein DLM66_00385 [Candidatus Dormibacteraeota bacterium]
MTEPGQPLDSRLDPWGQTQKVESVECQGVELRVGSRVVLRPSGRADIFDLELAGRNAVVQAIEEDFDDQLHVAVVLDDDPGRDLGHLRQPGHRFFFKPAELEPIE